MILCNKLKMKLNRERINEDFEIYIVSKEKGNFFKTNILDIAAQKCKAKSVVYYWGNRWFVMFDKGFTDYEKFKEIVSLEESESIIKKADIFDEKNLYPNILAQLLFNTLNAPFGKEFQYNNISGRLFYFRDEFMKEYPKSFYAAQLKLTEDCYLDISVKTFTRAKELHKKHTYARYIQDKQSGRFRKKLKEDKEEDSECYIEGRLNTRKKNTIDFLKFNTYKEFCNSKVGIYVEFMQDVEELLSDYISIQFGYYKDYHSFELKKDDFEITEYGTLLNQKSICIIDEVKNQKSNIIADRIQYELRKFYNVPSVTTQYDTKTYIIRIIFNEEHYIKNQSSDPYQDSELYKIVQHITVNDFKIEKNDKASPAFKKVIQELIIKSDIVDRKLSIVRWDKKEQWHFVKIGKKEWDDDRNKYFWNYYKMSINPDGSFEINTYYNKEFIEDEEWNYIDETFQKYNKEWKNREVEGMIYTDYRNINMILKTEQRTMPNYKKLAKSLKESDKGNALNRKQIYLFFQEFLKAQSNFKDTEDAKKLIHVLSEENGETITIGEILDTLSVRKKLMKQFNKYLSETTNILLHSTPKRADLKNEYFESILDIKYFRENEKFYYFVGVPQNKLQTLLHNACLVREVIAAEGEVQFQEILPLLAVEFVRNGQYTVLPFPFKYLNEVIRKCEKISNKES